MTADSDPQTVPTSAGDTPPADVPETREPPRTDDDARRGVSWRGFVVLASGQMGSLLGTGVSSMGVAMVAFIETGSVWWLSILYLASRVPALLVASHAGAVADRLDRRTVLLAADAVAGVATAVALGLHVTGALELWHLFVLAVFGSLANAYQDPAFQAAVPTLVDVDRLDRAGGLLQAGPAFAQLAAPALAGALVAWQGIGGVLALDLVTFALAVAATTAVRFPSPTGEGRATSPDVRGLRASWRHLDGPRRGLRRLIVAGAFTNLLVAMVNVLLLALVLPLAGEEGTGLLLSLGGLSMLVASVVVSVRGLPTRRVRTVAWGLGVVGLGLVAIGWRPAVLPVAIGLVAVLATVAVVGAAMQTIYHTTIEQEWQGRIAALRRVAAEGLTPITVLAVAPLVESVAEPAMAPDGILAGTVGVVLGTGPGRGIALVFVVAGLLVAGIGLALGLDRAANALDGLAPGGEPGVAPGEAGGAASVRAGGTSPEGAPTTGTPAGTAPAGGSRTGGRRVGRGGSPALRPVPAEVPEGAGANG